MVEGYAGTTEFFFNHTQLLQNVWGVSPRVVKRNLKNLRESKKRLSSASLPAVISVTKPLDYEQVPNGMIYLTVMAKDGGNPALNSTVPVTVEVIVSTVP